MRDWSGMRIMRRRTALLCVIAAAALVVVRSPRAIAQEDDPITDETAYAVYGALLPSLWATVSKGPLVLQRETEPYACPQANNYWDAEWQAIGRAFAEENARVRTLRPLLPVDIPYRLIAKAEIVADDARLALKYPGIWQRRPESMEFAAVSAVGFNTAKSKALVYVRLRQQGALGGVELRDGEWVRGGPGSACGWIA